ncbi:ABC-F family ATP-binding cassette domain-containing protein [Tsukamurella tyrosinosolvens]|uniref:ABC-F family ATP-binding cassette domain-containing protein n=1 Tax=Tsukamurella tyrosinosolvens TaxID=57704 RepID=UPI000796AE4B|nr:ABC-F family ATP-binding cassette domain-containing protein [Tsukamurella tyrosinosolvens]KXP02314.1 heme ABC transporter ATP-binding protein [Tsukamurella tyrosinosolvens]KZL96452.1 heme ABC transporter ATP-binding protein [Tsukamurella tyrosinosolvens]MCA4996331.1 ABC-F family ATP-binding cassette domain-containing protein [Tsukamurella tyrosinosolvens]WEL93712.1 ABC-F family ATP-binding cassette domain-containing protein [Tsukamurella tyrosinosolvens]
MTVLQTRDLSVAYADRTLFSGLDLVIAPGDVVGLVGANGAGKSTLLKLLAGLGADGGPDVTGTVDLSPADAEVGYLAQEHERRPGETVAQFVARRTGVAAAQEAMDAAALALGDDPDTDLYTPALDRWLALGGADLEQRLEAILSDVGLDSPDAAMTGLSGGQAARAGLAAVLASRYDVLLLDEPTNDLDLAGLELLERFVAEAATAIVVVSHDREFLARTVTTVVELDLAQQQIGVYGGGYEAYLTEREVARRHAREEYEEYSGKLSDLQDRAQMQRNWMEHGVRNARRKMKNGSDPDKAGRKARLESTEKQASKARQTERAIERLEVVAEPRKEWELRMSILAAPRSGTVVVTASGASVAYPGLTVGPVTVSVEYGDRILLTGPNGAGKSTLLGLLLGRLTPSAGSVVLGSGVEVGEVDQARGRFLSDGPLLDAFCAEVPETPPADVRTLLAKFGLRGHHVLRPASSLSPGERTRAALALLQARGVNLLVLDEPTNHLDLPAIEQLEQAVDSFDGTVILVTHDRRMLDTVRATRRWRMADGALTED